MARLLVNLPPSFYTRAELKGHFDRLASLAEVRPRSWNTPAEIRDDLLWCDRVLMWSWPALVEPLIDGVDLKFAAKLDLTQRSARALLARGVPVSVARSAFSPAVAEFALGLILSTLRRISDFHAEMRAGTEPWVKDFPADIDARERQLTGRSVGIVGLGQIGSRLSELLSPFRVTLRCYDPYVPIDVARARGATKVELDELLRESEVVVLAAASNEGSRHLIDARRLDLLRPGAVLVNTARAALVETDALVRRLARGDLHAAIDVFDQEPLPADHPLRRSPNCYLSPHRAGGVIESVQRILTMLTDDLENHLQGRPLKYPLHEAMVGALDA